MKLRNLLLLLFVTLLPSSLFSNTLYFPQVAFGGGYSTTVVLVNTGTTAVSAPLNFFSQAGALRSDLATQINLAPGNSMRFTLPNSGPLTAVWGEFAAATGTVQGVATFDLRNGSVLTTSAGVLGVEAGNSFLIPVDVTALGSTGVAVANTTGLPLNVRLRLFNENGAQTAASTDGRVTPLVTHAQVADFVTNLFPSVAGTTFKGTLLVEAPASAPPGALAVTALTVKEGLLSALPVVSGTAPGATTLHFPQVAFGGGYSTTVTVMAPASTGPVTAQLRFYSQSGAPRSDLTTNLNIPGGGSVRYTLPNAGPLTVVWAELLATSGTVHGVATFELRGPTGALVTSAGVLGVLPFTSFTVPVDVTPLGSTGIAVANVSNLGFAVTLRLIGEGGALVATATDTRFAALAGRAQIADFVTNIFPELNGTTFRGALIVEGAALATTALTVKEGLLSALPVITGTIVVGGGSGGGTGGGGGGTGGGGGGTGGGGGGTGGGGGGTGGSGPASDCFSPEAFNNALNVHLEYVITGAFTGTSSSDTVTTPNSSFEGQNLTELRSTVNTSYTGVAPTIASVRSYGKVDGLDILMYGSLVEITSPLAGTIKSVFTPPSRDKRYTLGVGQSYTQTYSSTTTTTLTGLPAPIVNTSSITETVTYLGRETVTVAPGTFDACKFDQGGTITWVATGSSKGVGLKTFSTSSGGSVTLELTSGTINGSAIRP